MEKDHYTLSRAASAQWIEDALVSYARMYGKGDFEVVREMLIEKSNRIRDNSDVNIADGDRDEKAMSHWMLEKHDVPVWARIYLAAYGKATGKRMIEVVHEAAAEKAQVLIQQEIVQGIVNESRAS
jgi:hypothetical protein